MYQSVHPGSEIKKYVDLGTALLIGAAVLLVALFVPCQAGADNISAPTEAHFNLPGTLVAQGGPDQSATSPKENSIAETSDQRLMGSDFRRTASYVHLFGSETFMYTDNVFNREKDTETDYISITELGVWAAAPRLNERVSLTETSTLAPGGLKYSRFTSKSTRYYQTYAMYSLGWLQYSKHHEESTADQTLGAYLQYNGVSNLSLEIWDFAREGADPAGVGDTKGRDNYRSNYLGTSATYDSGNRTYVQANASVFTLKYDKKQSEFRNRKDTGYSGFIFYRILAKTALFAEADVINMDYDNGFNNKQVRYYLGVKWEQKGISNGSFKVGAGQKNFSKSSEKDARNLSAELLLNHRFDSKKSASLSAQYMDEESAINTASYSRALNIIGEYRQKLRGKLSGVTILAFQDNSYYADGEKQREDKLWQGSIEAQYAFNRWIVAAMGYQRLWRNSDTEGEDFTTNNVYLKLSGNL